MAFPRTVENMGSAAGNIPSILKYQDFVVKVVAAGEGLAL